MISETERRIKILDYILQKSLDKDPKITKSDIMKHLKDSRPMTTHKITIELIKEGKIKMVKPKDKPYSQIDYLVINEDNEFNKIYNSLSEIENIIDLMDEPIHKIWTDFEVTQHPSFMDELTNLIRNFQTPYEEAINIMLQELLAIVNDKIRYEKDKEILYTRILKLMQKLKLQISGQRNIQVIEQLNSLVSRHLKHVKRSSFTGAKHINVDLATDVIDVIEKFKKEFLSETEQKTTEPPEK